MVEKNMIKKIEDLLDKSRSLVSTSPDLSLKLSNEALLLAQEKGYKKLEGFSLITIALAYRIKSDISNILDYSLEAIQIFEELDDIEGMSRALNLIGVSYFYNSMYEEAMRYFLKALEYVEKLDESYLESSILNNIAEIYRETKLHKKAINYYEKALKISKDNGYHKNMAVILGNIGQIYLDELKLSKALDYFKQGFNLLEEQSDPICISEMENRIGRVWQLMGDMKVAEQYYTSALHRLATLNHKYYTVDLLMNLASLYIDTDIDKSMDIYSRALMTSKEVEASNKLGQIYKKMAEVHEVNGDYKEALMYYKLYCTYKENQISITLENRIDILNIELKHAKNFNQLLMINERFERELRLQKLKIAEMNVENLILEKKASIDELTGILNRRSIRKKFHKIVEKAIKDYTYVAVYMIDIDNFKKYNDFWGHLQGDRCLIEVSKSIDDLSNDRGDIFGRYGGEEFLYIARPDSKEDALKLGEKIRKSVEELGLYYENNGDKIPVTISIGAIICCNENLKTIPLLLQKSDEQLYLSKRIGKNRVSLVEI